jgi:hypothetical protein
LEKILPRILFVKQEIDVFGPWRSITWENETPISVLNTFLYKPTFWEMTGFLRADWRIVPRNDDNHYYQNYIKPYPRVCGLLERHQTDICRLEEIPFENYDLVIANEPCIPLSTISRFPQTRFFYFLNEHSTIYVQQKLSPRPGYAAFLDHMCGEIGEPGTRALDMPYLRAPDMVRKCFPRVRHIERPRIWLDARTVIRETGSPGVWPPACDQFVKSLQSVDWDISCRSELYQRHYNIPEPGHDDAAAYYGALSGADFFIGIAAAGAGQSLCDAASLGLVYIGTPRLIYHRLICHPKCLCENLEGALNLALRETLSNPG